MGKFFIGIINYYRNNFAEAKTSWERSLELDLNPWALRNLAMLSWKDNQVSEAANLLLEARSMTPTLLPLTIELGRCLIESGDNRSWLDLVKNMPENFRLNGRIRLLEAQAALNDKELQIVKQFFDDLVLVADLREGENSYTDLWVAYHVQRISNEENLPINDFLYLRVRDQFPIPKAFDFRMSQM